ncbi:porin [Planctomycetota bacterium]|nr:porin [Planctomycetota bacterium]
MAKFWFMAMALAFGVSLASAPLAAQEEAPAEGDDAMAEENAEESVADTNDSDASTSVSLDKNLSWSTEDDAFALSLSTRVQFRVTYNDENGSGDGAGNTDGRDFWAMRIRRAKTTFKGHIFEKQWKYKFTVNWTDTGSNVETATLTWAGDVMYNVTVGQQKLQFNWQELTSSGKQMFADRSQVNESFNQDFAKGVTVNGKYADDSATWVKYWAGIYNGILSSDTDYRNADSNPISESFGGGVDSNLMFNVRVETYPLGEFTREGRDARGDDEKENPLFSVGFAFNWFQSDIDNTDLRPGSTTAGSGRNQGHVRTMAIALDAHLRWFGINLDIEFIRNRGEFFNTGALNTSGAVSTNARPTDIVNTGVIIEIGYMLTAEIQVGLRMGMNDQDEFTFGGTDGIALAHDSSEMGVVVNYYLHGHNLKATLDISYVDFQLANSITDAGGATGFNGFGTSRSPSSRANDNADHAAFWQLRIQIQWIF